MSYVVWPYMKIEDSWTIPIEVMMGVWNRMEELDRVRATFYDGGIQNAGEFIGLMQSETILPVLVVSSEKIKLHLLAWLSDIDGGSALAHFCYLDKYKKEITQMILDYWAKIPVLRVIMGITPESYKVVLKIIQNAGFQISGKIPELCDMYYENRIEAGVISYYLMGVNQNV